MAQPRILTGQDGSLWFVCDWSGRVIQIKAGTEKRTTTDAKDPPRPRAGR